MREALEHPGENPAGWQAICSIAEKIGCKPGTLRKCGPGGMVSLPAVEEAG